MSEEPLPGSPAAAAANAPPAETLPAEAPPAEAPPATEPGTTEDDILGEERTPRSKLSVFIMSFMACGVVVLLGAFGVGTIAYYVYDAYQQEAPEEEGPPPAEGAPKGPRGPMAIPPFPNDKMKP
jgi:hypothetical protein